MASPIAQLGYTLNGLEVQFTSVSLNINDSTTYAWTFGDSEVSDDKNPIHTYATEAFFTVTLTVTNGAESNTTEVIINLSGSPAPTLFTDIKKLVDLYAPTSILSLVSYNDQKEFLISKWQTYLQPLIINPSVTPENTYIENSWPPLANSLIGKLVVMDIIQMESSKFLVNTAFAGGSATINSSSSSSSSSTSNPLPGPIKTIETGPTKVERYENKDTSSTSEMQSNISKAFAGIMAKGGFLDILQSTICQEAQRINVFLPMCGLPDVKPGFQVTKPNYTNTYCK